MIIRTLTLISAVICCSMFAASARTETLALQDSYQVVTVIQTIYDVKTPVTSMGLSWRELGSRAGISDNGPDMPGASGNQGGTWKIPFEEGFARILNYYSSQGYELVTYSYPTAIFRKRQ